MGGVGMLDSIRIKTHDEETAVSLVDDVLARFRPRLVHEQDEWQVVVDGETEDDLPDLISILRSRLRGTDPAIDILVNGESYPLDRSY
jgi:hypothetical protein